MQRDFIQQFQVIIGHGPNCNDGATSMWAVWRTLSPEYKSVLAREGGFYAPPKEEEDKPFLHPNSVEGAIRLQKKGLPLVFVFSQPSVPIPNKLIRHKNVLILDLDLGDALIPLVTAANYVFVCDHHDTSQATLAKHADFLLSQNRHKFAQLINTSKKECGATLTWRLTHPTEIPPLVEVVRIGDTWQWDDRPDLQAKYVLQTLYVKRAFRSFPDIEKTYQNWDRKHHSWVDRGRIIYDYQMALVKQAAKQCDLGYIQTQDGTTYTVAYVQSSLLVSEIGGAIRWYAERRFRTQIDMCAVWKYNSRRDLVIVSLRDPGPGIKLGRVARDIKGSIGNGGGHAEAAGFSFQGIARFREVILPKKEIPIDYILPKLDRLDLDPN